jgi:serine protease
MLSPRNRQKAQARRAAPTSLTLEVLEDRTLLNAASSTVLDLNGLGVNPNKYSTTDILVRFQTPPTSPGSQELVKGTTLGSALPLVSGLYQINLDKGVTVAQALAAYKAEKGVLEAEPDYQLKVSSVPNDPLLSQEWYLHNTGQNGGTPGADIHAEQAWSVTSGSPNVVVAVIDTGIDYNNPDLVDNIWINQAEIPNYWYTKSSPSSGYDKIVYKWQIKTATPGIITFRDLNNPVNAGLVWKSDGNSLVDPGDLLRPRTQGGWTYTGNTQDGDTAHPNDIFGWNFVNNNNNPFDYNGHGTNVAGILGAVGNNGIGVVGVDPNVQIMPLQFMGADGSGTVSDFIQALNYSIQHGAKITNNSWEGAPYSQALYDAIANARNHGQIFVAAAGNEGTDNYTTPDYPASFSTSLPNVVAVAATTNTDQLAYFSNYGADSVALAAPGVNIYSTLPNNQYGAMSGTSMAAPQVAGAMALVWGLHPSWNYIQVIEQVLSTTDKLPSLQGKVETGGRLDVAAAVGWNLSTTTTPEITSVNVEGSTSSSMYGLMLTFNEPIDVSSFSSSAVRLTNPYGTAIPVSISVVPNSSDREIRLTFVNQTLLGNYKLSIDSSVRDLMGSSMSPYVGVITLHSAQTYTNSTAQAIKPYGLAMSSITVPPDATVGNVQVRLNIDYPHDGDLYLYLVSPTGKTIALDYNRGGTGANFSNTLFSQQASTPISNGRAPFYGAYLPEAALNQLIGSNASGTWRLGIRNSGSGSGTLANWSLILTPAPTIDQLSASSSTTSTLANTASTAASHTYTSSAPQAIKPYGLALSPISVPAGSTVGNVQVRVNVNYPDDANLYIYLISPTGKTVALDYNRGGTGANFSNTLFSQQAVTPIAKGAAPFYGAYIPEAELTKLVGSEAGGVWRLGIRNSGGGSGMLVNWSLILTSAATTSSVKVSSVDAPAVSTSNPSLAPTVVSHSNKESASTTFALAANVTVPPPLTPPPSAQPNSAATSSSAGLGKILSSVRSLKRFMGNMLTGKKPKGDDSDAASEA